MRLESTSISGSYIDFKSILKLSNEEIYLYLANSYTESAVLDEQAFQTLLFSEFRQEFIFMLLQLQMAATDDAKWSIIIGYVESNSLRIQSNQGILNAFEMIVLQLPRLLENKLDTHELQLLLYLRPEEHMAEFIIGFLSMSENHKDVIA